MKNSVNSEINNKFLIKVAEELVDKENPLPTFILGGHNVFNNSISQSVVIQLNTTDEDLAEALEKTPESIQKKVLDSILSVLEKKHSES
jgi:hypothetical protein